MRHVGGARASCIGEAWWIKPCVLEYWQIPDFYSHKKTINLNQSQNLLTSGSKDAKSAHPMI